MNVTSLIFVNITEQDGRIDVRVDGKDLVIQNNLYKLNLGG